MKTMSCKKAFTLIELLVVIAIVTILAACLLPVLSKGQERARVTQCLNNFHQAGLAIQLYAGDFSDRFPAADVQELNGDSKSVRFAIGGKDPEHEMALVLPSANVRPLHSYLNSAEVLHCPKDHGMAIHLTSYNTLAGLVLVKPLPTCWDTIGCSYIYNIDAPPSHFTMQPLADDTGLAGKKSDWVPEPSKYVLMYEPPAGTLGCPPDKQGAEDYEYQFWHYSSAGGANINGHSLRYEGRRFWAPILFVDGHVRFIDFTAPIQASFLYICEPTADCVWYKPKPDALPAN
jgi:prepilin-type N-terminal cleavage/methylation domain-containing protein/prepilin-type processing-associated H-X9-DG protein